MSEKEPGKVIPFAISASRLRRGAQEHRKHGRPVEAVELLRQAALREDSAQGWLALARQLAEVGCYEQAMDILYRLAGSEAPPDEGWFLLARCQLMLGQREPATDSLYHYLYVDPYSDMADAARDMLADAEDDERSHEPFRQEKLVSRAIASWSKGQHDESLRRFKRAMRLSEHPEQLHVTLALLMMMAGRFPEALKEANRACRLAPEDPRAATVRCVVVNSMGHRRMARGMLSAAAKLCLEPAQEDRFLSAAAVMGADAELKAYLTERLKLMPCRVTLLSALADVCWREGKHAQAEVLWHRVLRLDPENVRAAVLVRTMPEHPDAPLPPEGMIPQDELRLRMMRLAGCVVSDAPMAEKLRPGSMTRQLIDWSFTLADGKLQITVLGMLRKAEGSEVVRYLKQLLTVPTVLPAVRQKVLVALVDKGEMGTMNMMLGTRITPLHCTSVSRKKSGPWQQFLPVLLNETRRWRQSPQIVASAAAHWQRMSKRQRAQAIGGAQYAWVKAMELDYLRRTEQVDEFMETLLALPVSARRIERVLRQLVRLTVPTEGE